MLRANIKQIKWRLGCARSVRNSLLVVGFSVLLLFTGSAFSDSLNIRIKNLVRLPSQRSLPVVPAETSPPLGAIPESNQSGIRILAIRTLAARSGLAPPIPTVSVTRAVTPQPSFGNLEEVFDPARFDQWDRKNKPPGTGSEAKETWVFIAGLAFQYDTNLYRNPTEDDPAVGAVTDTGDGSIIGWGGAEYRLDLGDGLISGIHMGLRAQRYFQETQADTASITVGAYIHDRRSWGGLLLPYSYTYWWDGSGFDARASIHSVNPSIYWQALEDYRLEATAIYENRHYSDETHNAHRLGLRLGHQYDLSRPGTYLRLDNRLSNDFAGDEGYLLAEVTLGGGMAIWKELRFEGGLTYARFWFKDRPAAEIGQAGSERFSRRDNQFRANAKLYYRFSPVWQLGIDYVLTLNNSNVDGTGGFDPHNFHKHVLTLMASGRF